MFWDITIWVVRYVVLGSIVGIIAVDFFGYSWHRWVEHGGWLGSFIMSRHIQHHDVDYPFVRYNPEGSLRTPIYNSAWSWSWLVLGLLVTVLVWSLAWLTGLYYDALAITVSAIVYGFGFINKFHDWYHVSNLKVFGYRMNKYSWFKWLTLMHDVHHVGPYNYGIIGLEFDWLFGTFRNTTDVEQIRDFPERRVRRNINQSQDERRK